MSIIVVGLLILVCGLYLGVRAEESREFRERWE